MRWWSSSFPLDSHLFSICRVAMPDCPREPSLVLIVKWGGELTPAGKIQAEELGKAFRTLYPGGQGKTDFWFILYLSGACVCVCICTCVPQFVFFFIYLCARFFRAWPSYITGILFYQLLTWAGFEPGMWRAMTNPTWNFSQCVDGFANPPPQPGYIQPKVSWITPNLGLNHSIKP